MSCTGICIQTYFTSLQKNDPFWSNNNKLQVKESLFCLYFWCYSIRFNRFKGLKSPKTHSTQTLNSVWWPVRMTFGGMVTQGKFVVLLFIWYLKQMDYFWSLDPWNKCSHKVFKDLLCCWTVRLLWRQGDSVFVRFQLRCIVSESFQAPLFENYSRKMHWPHICYVVIWLNTFIRAFTSLWN